MQWPSQPQNLKDTEVPRGYWQDSRKGKRTSFGTGSGPNYGPSPLPIPTS